MRCRTLALLAPDMTSGPNSPTLRPARRIGDAVADGQRLPKLVGDEDDGDALIAQAAQELEEGVDLAGRQDGRRLIEEEDACAAEEDLDDLDALPLAKSEMANLGLRRDIEAEVGHHRRDPGLGVAEIENKPATRAECHVLQDGEVGDKREVLVDGADAAVKGIAGRRDLRPPGRRCRSCRRRADTSRRGCSSASSCRRRSRRGRRGPRPARDRARRDRWRRPGRSAW